MIIERSATIARTPEDVYAVLADVTKMTQWREDVISNERISPEGPLDGAKFREVIKTPIGNQTVTVQISTVASKSFGFKVIDGMLRPQGSVELTPDGGATKLAYRIELKPMLGKPSPLDNAAAAFLGKTMDRSIELLKALLEG